MSLSVRPSPRQKILSLLNNPGVRILIVAVLSAGASIFLWRRSFLLDREVAREFLSIISTGCFTVLSLSPVVYIQSYAEVQAVCGDFLGLRVTYARIEAMSATAGASTQVRSELAEVMEEVCELDRDFGEARKRLHDWFVYVVFGISAILAYCFLMLANIQRISDASGFYWLILCCAGILDGIYESFAGYFRVRRLVDGIGTALREIQIRAESILAELQVVLQTARGISPAAPNTQNTSPKAEPSNSADQ